MPSPSPNVTELAGSSSPMALGQAEVTADADQVVNQSGAASRRVILPGGGSVLVRSTTADDVEGLWDLFEGLSFDDLYRRFFQAHAPSRQAVERMTEATTRGDISLVAELEDKSGVRRLVAEAGCARLPDGDGELALTVAVAARGWLGPYLLALLCDEAAARGIPNLQADVLADNRPMLALARARGYATMDHSDRPSIVRVTFSTTERVPSWPPFSDGPRVVVEAPGARWHGEREARSTGLHLLVCPGPAAPCSQCPAMRGRRCPLVAEADLVVDAVDPRGSDAGSRLLRAHRTVHADRTLYVEPLGTPPADPAQFVRTLWELIGTR